MPQKQRSKRQNRKIRYQASKSDSLTSNNDTVTIVMHEISESTYPEQLNVCVPIETSDPITYVNEASYGDNHLHTNAQMSAQCNVTAAAVMQTLPEAVLTQSVSSLPPVQSKGNMQQKILKLHARTRVQEIRQKLTYQRIVNNMVAKEHFVPKQSVRYLHVHTVKSLVQKALTLKNRLFGRMVQSIKPLDTLVKELAANCSMELTLKQTNFCKLLGGMWCHTSSSERFYHDEMYYIAAGIPLAVTESGRCLQYHEGEFIDHEEMHVSTDDTHLPLSGTSTNTHITYVWRCTQRCNIRIISCQTVRKFIMALAKKKTYAAKMKMLRNIDNCPIRVHSGLLGHSLACLTDGVCPSILHHVRMLAAHHTVMRTLADKIYKPCSIISVLTKLNNCLINGTASELKQIIDDIQEQYLQCDIQSMPEPGEVSGFPSAVSAEKIILKYAREMAQFADSINDFPTYICVSCRRMCYKIQIQYVDLVLKVASVYDTQWTQLALYLIIENKFDVLTVLVICKYCYKYYNMNSLPARSVLNGMHVEPIPACMQHMNNFELICLKTLHPFQVVVRLQTKSGKFHAKELYKGLKGKIVYLPLHLKENVETLAMEGQCVESLLILVNGVATKDKKIWQQLVDVGKLRTALQYLKQNNIHYSDVEINALLDINTIPGIDDNSKGQFEFVPPERRLDLYEHFTIYSIQPQEERGDSLELYQMKRAKAPPTSVYEQSLEARCFPNLFPTGVGGRLDKRKIFVSATEYRTSRMYSEDRRFASNAEYIFHLFFESEFSAVCQAVQHTLKTGTRFKHCTAKEIVDNIQQQSEVLENNVSTIFSTVRGTKPYWLRRYSEVCCMLRHLGPPTWFLTLSCAEYEWPELIECIKTIHSTVPGIESMSATQICSLDPVMVCRFFDKRFKAMLRFICNTDNPPLGLVSNYFYRKEYQSRGSPHIHMLIWVHDAPVFGVDEDEKILQFINKYICTEIPAEEQNADLRAKVLKFQLHHCGQYCRRRYHNKDKYYTKCRFGFPRPVTSTGLLNNVMSSVRHMLGKKSPKNTYNAKRNLDCEYVNDYHAVILMLWNANMDLQFVADNATVVALYVTGYITKPEKSHAHEIWLDLAADKSMAQRLKTYGVVMLQARECGVFEAVDLIVGTPIFGRSRQVLWIPLGPAHLRKRVLKRFEDIQQLAQNSPSSTFILKDNLLDTYYPNRAVELENMTLFDIASNYTFKNVEPDESKGRFPLLEGNGCLVKHNKPVLLNHRKLSTDTEEDKEMFYFCLLQLFKPWRSEEELLCSQSTYEAAFDSVQSEITTPTLERYLQMLQQEKEQTKFIEAELLKDTPHRTTSLTVDYPQPLGTPFVENEVHFAMGEVESAMQQAAVQRLPLNTIVANLNKGQREIYNDIVKHIEANINHTKGLCSCLHSHQILRFISGEAGTGKSFLIRALQQYLLEKTGSPKSCVVTAPTGLAAFNVSGITLHRLLMLPVEHDNRMEYNKLSPDAAHEIARVLRKVELIIIDEVSMVSNLMLVFVHLRIQEVLRAAPGQLFAGKHIVVFGDLLQLTPVKGEPVFTMLSAKDAVKGIGSIGLVNLWNYFQYHELTENMRQADDLKYGSMLQGIRIGNLTAQVKEMLESRTISKLFPHAITGPEVMLKLKDAGLNCVALMPTIADCNKFNNVLLLSEQQPVHEIKSIDAVLGEMLPQELHTKIITRLKALETSVSHTAGLDSILNLCLNCRVMLRRNIDVPNGLVNGAMGYVVKIISQEKDGVVTKILVKFDAQDEPASIVRVFARFKILKDIYIKRMQFPISAAYAITIHKAQGLSLDNALIDIGAKVFKEAMAYVALSRVKKLSGLFILEFEPQKIAADPICVAEYNRLRQTYTPHLPLFKVPEKKNPFKEHTAKSKVHRNLVPTIPEDAIISIPPTKKRCKQKNIINEPPGKTIKRTRVTFKNAEPTVEIPLLAPITSFSNDSGVECYCNAVIQLLFHMHPLMALIKENPVGRLSKCLASLYEEHQAMNVSILNAIVVRLTVATSSNMPQFIHLEQQDCHEFLLAILNVLIHENPLIHPLTSVSYSWLHTCVNCQHQQQQRFQNERNIFLPIPEMESVRFHTLTHLADHNISCGNCGSNMLSALSNVIANKYIFLVLTRYSANGIKVHTKIQDFDSLHVSLGGHNLVTKAIIYHQGEQITEGHYITWLRSEKGWLECNDSKITMKMRLPFWLKNAYVLLLEKN